MGFSNYLECSLPLLYGSFFVILNRVLFLINKLKMNNGFELNKKSSWIEICWMLDIRINRSKVKPLDRLNKVEELIYDCV